MPASRTAANATGQAVTVNGMVVNYYSQLHREYIHFLLSRMHPRPPAWFEEGLAQTFMNMLVTPRKIVFGQLKNPNAVSLLQKNATDFAAMQTQGDGSAAMAPGVPGDDDDFNQALGHARLMPLDQMFAVTRDSPLYQQPLGTTWSKQCAAFVHLCLLGRNQIYQKGFLNFVYAASQEKVTEELFRKCFNRNYAQMLAAIHGYIGMVSYKYEDYNFPKGKYLDSAPALNLRDATPGEIGRIKGDALRMAGHPEDAHLTLIAPYIRGSRDPEPGVPRHR